MDRPASVEIYERSDNAYYITVQPSIAVQAVRKHLLDQEDIIMRDAFVAGDLAFEVSSNRSVEDVIKGAATIAAYHGKSKP